MRRLSFIPVFFLLVLVSCNIPRMVDRHQHNKWSRRSLHSHAFEDSSAVHHAYAHLANKPVIVFIHGYGASGIAQYYRTGLLLSDEFDLVFPDLLRCGRSRDKSDDPSVSAQVTHLKTTLDSLGVNQPFILVGNSYGGIVASRFAHEFPHQVAKLVLYDSPAYCYTSAYAHRLADSLSAPSFPELLTPATVPLFKKSLDLVFYRRPYIPAFLLRQALRNTEQSFRDHQMLLLHHLLDNEEYYNNQLLYLPMPVYLIWGEEDRLIPLSTARCIAEKLGIPDDQVIILPEAAHAANLEYPEEFAEIIRRIAAGQGATRNP